MRVVVAMMSHETNTFSPVPTPIESFGVQGIGWALQLAEVEQGVIGAGHANAVAFDDVAGDGGAWPLRWALA